MGIYQTLRHGGGIIPLEKKIHRAETKKCLDCETLIFNTHNRKRCPTHEDIHCWKEHRKRAHIYYIKSKLKK